MEALGKPLHPSQVCELVMDFVGDGTPLARALLEYQKRHKTVGADATEPQQVSNGWYTGFLERNQEQIKSKKPKAHDIKRKEWGNDANVRLFYHLFYERLVDNKIAVKLPEPVWMDKQGNIVESEGEAWGRKTQYKMLHSWAIIHLDEKGNNTDQSKDGNCGGERTCGAVGAHAHISCSMANCRWTNIPCFASNGQLLTNATIFQNDNADGAIPLSTALGHDVGVNAIDHEDPRGVSALECRSWQGLSGLPRSSVRG